MILYGMNVKIILNKVVNITFQVILEIYLNKQVIWNEMLTLLHTASKIVIDSMVGKKKNKNHWEEVDNWNWQSHTVIRVALANTSNVTRLTPLTE